MRNRHKMAAGLVFLMCLAVGCGGKEPQESSAVSTETIEDAENMSKDVLEDGPKEEEDQDTQPENETESGSTGQSEENGQDGEKEESGDKVFPMKEGEESLSGKVRSIGENSVVISKIFIEDDENGKGSIVILPGEGNKEEELVTVNFTSDTIFHHWTIKSGGADIDMRESSFSEIEMNSGLEMSGFYEGETFIASRVIIEVYQ